MTPARWAGGFAAAVALVVLTACSSPATLAVADAAPLAATDADAPLATADAGAPLPDADPGAVVATAACRNGGGTQPVAAPRFVMNLAADTGWFSSPAIVDLEHAGTRTRALVVASAAIDVYDPGGRSLQHLPAGGATSDRIYAPAPIGDFDGDGATDLAVGSTDGTIAMYTWNGTGFELRPGWPGLSTCSGGDCPETRGLAAADLDGDGIIETVFTTTNGSDTGSQVYVFEPDGSAYQPPAARGFTAWPRYNQATGAGGDADWNGVGNHAYGAYGENVAIGQLDDGPELEIVVTFDDHQINVFHHDGESALASSWFSDPLGAYLGQPMGWGQLVRWADPEIEEDFYHLHTGAPPDPANGQTWLQWTATPPVVADLDGDGANEVIGFANGETGDPYQTTAYYLTVLDGNQGDGSRAAMRHPGFTALPASGRPSPRAADDYYPPDGIPAPAVVNLVGDPLPEIVVSLNDGTVRAYSGTGATLWRYDVTHGEPHTFMSEPVIADLNGDGRPEVIFGTYSLAPDGGHLMILSNTGALLHDVPLPDPGQNGNGIGIAAAPTVGDLDGDGQLEIAVLTFDHGVDVFTVPGSGTACLPWPTGRANLLRNGQGPASVR